MFSLIVGGCAASPRQTDSPDGGVADQGGIRHDLRGADLTVGRDLAAHPSDLANADLAGDDLAAPPDLSVADQSVAVDQSMAPDLTPIPDMSVPPDLTVPPDLRLPPQDMFSLCACAHPCFLGAPCNLGCCFEDVVANKCLPNPLCAFLQNNDM